MPKSVSPPQKSKILKSGPKCAPGYPGTELLWPDHDWRSFGVCGAELNPKKCDVRESDVATSLS